MKPKIFFKTFLSCYLACILFVSGSGLAKADYFGKWYADSSYHDFWYSYTNLGSARYNGIRNARLYSLENTDMRTAQKSQYSTTVDVAVIMKTPNPDQRGWYAWTYCPRKVSSTRCGQHIIAFSTTVSHSNYWSLACHEIGHTVGLKDGQASTYGHNSSSTSPNRSCMRSRPDWTYYSNHDKGHINAKY